MFGLGAVLYQLLTGSARQQNTDYQRAEGDLCESLRLYGQLSQVSPLALLALADVHGSLGIVSRANGSVSEAVQHARQAVALLEQAGNRDGLLARAHLALANALKDDGRYREAEPEVRSLLDEIGRQKVAAEAQAQQHLASRRGDGFSRYTLPLCGVVASAWLRQGRNADAARKIDECVAAVPEADAAKPAPLLELARAELAFSGGDLDRAKTLMSAQLEALPPEDFSTLWLRPRMLAAELAFRQGDAAGLRALAESLKQPLAAPQRKLGDASPAARRMRDCLEHPAGTPAWFACWIIP